MALIKQLILTLGLVLMISGCGIKGPLYLPTPEPQAEAAPEPAESDANEATAASVEPTTNTTNEQ
ncbi:LPS translocon maturation chaperone LptM [Motilimonas pumila]|uniref:Lipoprotein n=1 Tax=Motilimonas pumila TaxID=2303987 RepID=A0A418YBX2_9GAMM|nr:lipoprotein [Motilimonas pumila]RJG41952.1 hypothetical protein D1Z90_15795 [Motilimonas pumila]